MVLMTRNWFMAPPCKMPFAHCIVKKTLKTTRAILTAIGNAKREGSLARGKVAAMRTKRTASVIHDNQTSSIVNTRSTLLSSLHKIQQFIDGTFADGDTRERKKYAFHLGGL